MLRLLKFAAIGAVLVYFFRKKVGHPGRLGRIAKSQAFDVKQKVKNLKDADKPQPDDVTLARKVETEIFRDADVPKGRSTSMPRTVSSSFAARSRSRS